MANLYKIAAERKETVIRSHDPRFMDYLADFLQGNPVHPAIEDEFNALGRDLAAVLSCRVKSSAKEM